MAPLDRKLRAPEDRVPASWSPRGRTGSSREQASEVQRTRILSATVALASEVGTESATVTQIVRRAGVSSGTFYALFEDRQDCLTAVFEEAVAIATKHMSAAYDTQATWVDRIRAAVLALLELLDEERELARLCVGHAVASSAMLMRREEVLDQLSVSIDEGRSASRAAGNPPPLAAQAVLGGALGLIYSELSARDARSMVELLNPLMFWIVLPYLGVSAACEEQHRQPPARRSASG
jgi:AcrR family transcriptional regulator